jgi:hypothetical protein
MKAYFSVFIVSAIISESICMNETTVKNWQSACQHSINEWQRKYKHMKETVYALEIDDVVNVAINTVTMLPIYVSRLNALLAQCTVAVAGLNVLEDEPSNVTRAWMELLNKSTTENNFLSEKVLLTPSMFKSKNAPLNNSNEFLRVLVKAQLSHLNLTNYWIRKNHISHIRKIVDSIKQQQSEFARQTTDLMKNVLKKLTGSFPIVGYFIKSAEIHLNIDLDSRSIGFSDLKVLLRVLSKDVRDNLRSLMAKLPTFNVNEINYNYRNAKYTILFMNKLCEFIEPLVDFNETNFSNILDGNMTTTNNWQVQSLCDVDINQDLLKADKFCSWISAIVGRYFDISRSYNEKIIYETYSFFKRKI